MYLQRRSGAVWSKNFACVALGSLLLIPACMEKKITPAPPVKKSSATSSDKALDSYRALQRVSFSRANFLSDFQEAKIQSLLQQFSEQTKDLHRSNSEFQDVPSFGIQLRILSDEAAQTYRHFKSGKKEYALSLLRSLDANCSSCHISHGVEAPTRIATPPKEASMSLLDRAEFYLTRGEQKKGERLLRDAIRQSDELFERSRAMDLLVRFYVSSKLSSEVIDTRLSELVKQLDEDSAETDRIRTWRQSFEREGKIERLDVEQTIALLKQMRAGGALSWEEREVEILEIERHLHDIMAKESLEESQRMRASCALGKTYDMLPSPMYDSLAKRCLIFCIEKYPGSSESREAYEVLRHRVLLGYTGSSGTHLPPIVEKRLEELDTLAQG